MNIYKHKFLSRIGMMHMIAVNLCVWLNVLILETSHEIVGHNHEEEQSGNYYSNHQNDDDYGSHMNMTNGKEGYFCLKSLRNVKRTLGLVFSSSSVQTNYCIDIHKIAAL